MITGKNKKIAWVILIVFLLGVAALVSFEDRNRRTANNVIGYSMPGNVGMMQANYQGGSFTLPQDALKSGEIAAKVNYLDAARAKVDEIARQNEGKIYETNVSYLSSNVRNAIIVLQMPEEKFEDTFAALKSAGFDLIRESTRQIPPISVYPLNVEPVPATEALESQESNDEPEQSEVKGTAEGSQSLPEAQGDTEPQKAIYPQPQIQTQNKGYIKVILADYSRDTLNGLNRGQNRSGMMFFQNPNQDFSNVMWIALGIKLTLLITMFCLLIFLSVRMVTSFRRHRASKGSQTKPATKKAVVHVIRKMPKTKTVKRKI